MNWEDAKKVGIEIIDTLQAIRCRLPVISGQGW